MEPPLERIEFLRREESRRLPARCPKGWNRPPVVMHWAASTVGKKIAGRITTCCSSWGLLGFTIDMPGGPVKIRVSVTISAPEPTFSAAMDYLETRGEHRRANGSPAWAAASAAMGGEACHTEPKRLARRGQLGRGRASDVQEEWLRPAHDRDRVAISHGSGKLARIARLVHIRRQEHSKKR